MMQAAATAAIMLSSFPSRNRFVTKEQRTCNAAVDFSLSESSKVINSLDLELRRGAWEINQMCQPRD